MFSKTRIVMFALLLALMSLLGACALGGSADAQATPTEVDVNAVYTQAVETARARLTEMAPDATSTNPPAPTDTETLAPAATDAATTDTSQPLTQITITVTVNPIITATQDAITAIVVGTMDPAATSSGLNTPTLFPSITPIATSGNSNVNEPLCKNSAFEGDVTIPDGTLMNPWEKFTKIWRVRNSGFCTWDEGFTFKAWSGPSSMANPEYFYRIRKKDKFVPAGAVIDVPVEMYAPGEAGEYVAHWAWFDDTDKAFGADFTVVINVVK